MPEPKYIVVNGVRLAYVDVGTGPAILFIHGFMLDRTMWCDQVVALEGWRRIAPDLRGMGQSDAPEGGYVAFEFLRRHRERVAALVVLDARPEADTAERKLARNHMIARVRNDGARVLAEELPSTFLRESASADVRKRLKEMMVRTSVAGIVGALEAMRDRPDSRPLLHSIASLPTQLLIGGLDTRTPRASMHAMADQISGATFEVIPRAGHLPPLDNSEETTRSLRRFLDGLKADEL